VRQDPSRTAGALEAFIVDKSDYPLQDWLQALREFQIEVELLPPRMDFEDH
jgi:hypothetical protein